MKKLILAILLVSTGAANAAPSLEELRKQKSCITQLQNAHENLDTVMNTWILGDNNALTVNYRLKKITAEGEKIRKKVLLLAESFVSIPDERDALIAAMEKVETLATTYRYNAEALLERERNYYSSLSAIVEALAIVRDRLHTATPDCGTFGGDVIEEGLTKIVELEKYVASAEFYVLEMADKRDKLFEVVYFATKQRIYERYADLTRQQLENAIRDIDIVFAASAFQDSFQKWWSKTKGPKGLGKGLAGEFLQYTEPLSIMEADRLEGQKFLDQIPQLEGVPEGIKRAVSSELTTYIGILDRSIADLKEHGLEGTLALQAATNDRRLEMIDQFPATCKPAIEQYAAFSERLNRTQDDAERTSYTQVEKSYVNVVLACKGGVR